MEPKGFNTQALALEPTAVPGCTAVSPITCTPHLSVWLDHHQNENKQLTHLRPQFGKQRQNPSGCAEKRTSLWGAEKHRQTDWPGPGGPLSPRSHRRPEESFPYFDATTAGFENSASVGCQIENKALLALPGSAFLCVHPPSVPPSPQVTPFVNALRQFCALCRPSSCLLTPFPMPPAWPGHHTALTGQASWISSHTPPPTFPAIIRVILGVIPHLLILGADPCNHLSQFFRGWQPSAWHLLSLQRGPEEREALIIL